MENEIKLAEAKPKLTIKHHIKKNKHLSVWIGLIILAAAASALIIYFYTSANKVYIENAQISADQISLAPHSTGILQEVDVNEGDTVSANTVVARVGTELIKTNVAGTIIAVQKNIGAIYNPGQAMVTMIDNSQLKVVGGLDENKGLKDIQVGRAAVFTVDAYPGKKYYGVVEEIKPTSQQSQVIFNISSQRQEQQFNIKVRFDIKVYPELKNGMSAKIWVYKQ